MEQQTQTKERSKYWPFLWLALAAIFFAFSNGKWNIPVATWLFLIFSLRFFRTYPLKRAFIIYTLVAMIPFYFAWQGIVAIPEVLYPVFVLMICFTTAFILLIDRLLAPKFEGLLSTLVYPLASVTIQYIMILMSPYSSFGSLAYSQYGNLPLSQMISLTGLSGITFLLAWSASIVNWVWDQQFEWRKVWRGVLIYVCILVVILLAGGAHLISPSRSETVRVAAIPATKTFEWNQKVYDSLIRYTTGEITETELETIHFELDNNIDDLIERSEREAKSGAKIIFWSEGAGIVLKEDESALIERGRMLAGEEEIYLGMALATLNSGQRLAENKIVLIEPSGDIAWQYFKAKPVPGEAVIQGDGDILTLDTPYGKIATAICYDMDHPNLIYQAGKAEVDIMFNPSNDQEDVARLRMHMATFRAIENGFSLVRPTSNGYSIAIDPNGRILAISDYSTNEDPVMIAYVPTKGVATIYSRVGDVFPWLCVSGFVAVIGWALVFRRMRKSSQK